jgi:hypothetical protein
LVALALVGGLACSDDPTGPPNPEGTYDLTTVEGAAIPVTVDIATQDPGVRITSITGGTLILRDDDTYAMALLIRVTSGSTTSNGVINFTNGTYTFTAGAVELSGGPGITATIGNSNGDRTLSVPMGIPFGTLVFAERD